MIGKNELMLNQETMREALQEYLRKRMPATPLEVVLVAPVSEGRAGDRTEVSRSYKATDEGGSFRVVLAVQAQAGTEEPDAKA